MADPVGTAQTRPPLSSFEHAVSPSFLQKRALKNGDYDKLGGMLAIGGAATGVVLGALLSVAAAGVGGGGTGAGMGVLTLIGLGIGGGVLGSWLGHKLVGEHNRYLGRPPTARSVLHELRMDPDAPDSRPATPAALNDVVVIGASGRSYDFSPPHSDYYDSQTFDRLEDAVRAASAEVADWDYKRNVVIQLEDGRYAYGATGKYSGEDPVHLGADPVATQRSVAAFVTREGVWIDTDGT